LRPRKMQGDYNLEVMEAAVNYRQAVINLFKPYLADCRKIADFGAGRGTYARELTDTWPDIYCIEPARDFWQSCPGLSWLESLNDLPEQLDAIYTLNVLEHIEYDEKALTEINRRLSPGGKLFVLVPAHKNLWTEMDNKVGHIRRYSTEELTGKVINAGFEVLSTGYFDWVGYLATKAHQVLKGNGSPSVKQIKAFDKVFAWMQVVRLPEFGKNVYLCGRKLS